MATKSSMTFLEAVKATPEVKDAGCPGLKAIEAKDKPKIDTPDPTKVDGSLNIDLTLVKTYPGDTRWDYAISYNNKVCYLEIHPALDKEIKKMNEKLIWLKWWLAQKAPHIKSLETEEHPYLWVPSGKTGFLSMATARKKIAVLGLDYQNRLVLK